MDVWTDCTAWQRGKEKRSEHYNRGHTAGGGWRQQGAAGGVLQKREYYAHILDEDRKVNAMKFETSFYNIKADLRNVQAPQEEQAALDVSALIEQLQKSPELLQTLSQLIAAKN